MKSSILNSRRVLLVLISVFYLNTMTSQEIKMYPEGAVYGYLSCFGPPGIPGAGCYGRSEPVTQLRDTLIQTKTYQISSHGITRYENQKFYFYNQDRTLDQFNFPDNEYVLYDFGLQVNDTFRLPWPRTTDTNLVVTSRTQRLMHNGEYRTELTLRNSNWTFRWIEGIGDVQNGLFYMSQIGLYDISAAIVCFSDKNGLIYKRDGFEYPCENIDNYIDLWSGLSEEKNENNRVYPNPFTSHILLTLEIAPATTHATFNLYSTDGRLIRQVPVTERGQVTHTVDLSDLPPGLYLARLQCDHEITHSFKISKKES